MFLLPAESCATFAHHNGPKPSSVKFGSWQSVLRRQSRRVHLMPNCYCAAGSSSTLALTTSRPSSPACLHRGEQLLFLSLFLPVGIFDLCRIEDGHMIATPHSLRTGGAVARARRCHCRRTPCRTCAAARARRCWRRRTPCTRCAAAHARKRHYRCTPCSCSAPVHARRCCCRRTPCICCAVGHARRGHCRRTPCTGCADCRARRCRCRRTPCTRVAVGHGGRSSNAASLRARVQVR